MSVRALFNRPLNSVAHVDYLDLPGIITTQIQETDEQISVKAEEAEQMNKCPNCGKEGTLKGDGSPPQGFWDRPDGKPRGGRSENRFMNAVCAMRLARTNYPFC